MPTAGVMPAHPPLGMSNGAGGGGPVGVIHSSSGLSHPAMSYESGSLGREFFMVIREELNLISESQNQLIEI